VSDLAPIVLFVYNRPDHTCRTLAALAANSLATKSDLIIYADGPKKPEHTKAVEQARDAARNASGFKSITIIEQEKNLGLANSIIKGVSDVCSARGRAIVVEDDLLVSPHFLTFLNRGLERYADEDRVLQVSGYMFPRIPVRAEALFLPITTTWGWATWSRAWKHFDPNMKGLDLIRADPNLRCRFDINGAYNYFSMAEQQRLGALDSWGIRWYLTAFLRNGLTLYPGRSLARNIGVDGSGTHGAGHAELQEAEDLIERKSNAFRMPDRLEIDAECLSAIEQLLRSMQPTGIARWVGLCRRGISSRLRLMRKLKEKRVD
jgi:hypothetical protein